MKIYFAGPLFTLAERRFNQDLASSIKKLTNDIIIILPQHESEKITESPDFSKKTLKQCLQAINDCDILLAILDGADADSGTCIELGYAYAQGKPIVGLRTDFRLSEDRGLNLMVANICTWLIMKSSLTTNVNEIAREIVNILHEVV